MDFERVNLPANGGTHADELREGEVLDHAIGDLGCYLLVDGVQVAGEGFKLGVLGAEEAFFGLFEPEEPELMDTGPGALVPVIEGGSGNADFLGDFRDGKALDPEFDEFVYQFAIMHML